MEHKTELFDLFQKFTTQNECNYLSVPMQTGSGKTYTAVQFMKDFIEDHKKPEDERVYPFKRIVYATGLKNNLPWKDLKEELSEVDFNDHVLVVNSNTDSVEEGYRTCSEYKRRQLDSLDIPSRRELMATLEKLGNAREQLQYSLHLYSDRIPTEDEKRDRTQMIQLARDTLKSAEDNFKQKESEFRKDIRRIFFKEVNRYLSVNSKKPELTELSAEQKVEYARNALMNSIEWKWLEDLYPVSQTSNRNVIFMSVTKLILVYDTIVGPKNLLYNSDFTDNTLFIIDEVDAAKTTIISQLMSNENLRKYRIDPTEMFRAILKALHDKDNHPVNFYEVYGEPDNDRLRKFADDVTKQAEQMALGEQFNLNKRFFLESGESQRYIFHDYRALAISGGLPVYAPKNGKNYLDLDFKGEIDKEVPLERLFASLNRFFSFFASLVRQLAINLKNREEGKGKICPLDMAVRSVLDVFELASIYDQYIELLVQKLNQKKLNERFENDSSFYNLGFRHYEIESSREHSETSKMYQTAYDTTPEKMILQMLSHEGTKLIGISATATIYSVISNFDVNYLYAQDSPCKPYLLSDEDIIKLKEMYRASTCYYDEVLDIEVIPVDQTNTESKDIVGNIRAAYDLDDLIKNAVNRFEARNNKQDGTYIGERYRRFAIAYHEFIEKSNAKYGASPILSELALFTISSKDDDPAFKESTLKEICNIILNNLENKEPDLEEEPLMVLRGKDYFDEDFKKISERLGQGKKVFILSTYQTVGSGQNLQYPVPAGIKTVQTNDFKPSGMKDIDAIYLDGLTNLIPYVRKGQYDQRDEYIYDIEELGERGELTSKEINSYIRSAFDRCAGNMANTSTLKNIESVILTCIRAVAQGVGRITRTNTKNPNVYIFADIALAPYFQRPLERYGALRSIEFEKLYETMHAINMEFKQRKESEECKDIASAKAAKRIDAMLNGIKEKREESIKEYDALGELVLKHPTCESFLDNGIMPSIKVPTFYTRLSKPADRMTYAIGERDKENSYSDVICETKAGNHEVSMSDCNLSRMTRFRIIRDGFKEKGYATGFGLGTFIMAPPTYNRVYKGRLGEVAGRILLEHLGIPYHRMPIEHYEMFDDQLTDDTYIDYKNWNSRENEEKDRVELDKAFSKLSQLGGKKLYIMNIMKPNWDMPPVDSVTRDDMTIIQIPYMLDDTNTMNDKAVSELLKVKK